jgi:hypothetical protein
MTSEQANSATSSTETRSARRNTKGRRGTQRLHLAVSVCALRVSVVNARCLTVFRFSVASGPA